MLASNKIVGFVPTKNFKKARAFYEQVLGLEFVSQDPFALEFRASDRMIRVSKVPDLTPAPYTILGWEVQNIENVVKELTDRGVTFEHYSWMQQDDLGIWNAPDGGKVAWFKDPDDNILSVSQH